jgi:hypothetical protein
VLKKKLKMVTLVLLTISAISCSETIPVKLQLPEMPRYYHNVTDGITVNRDTKGKLIDYSVSIESMLKLGKNKALCREDNTVLRAIILTTH